MFPVTQDRRRKTVGSGCEDHGQQSRLFSRRSIPAAVPLLPPPSNSLICSGSTHTQPSWTSRSPCRKRGLAGGKALQRQCFGSRASVLDRRTAVKAILPAKEELQHN